MKGNNEFGCLDNPITSEGKPPNPRTPSCGLQSPTDGVLKPCRKSLVRRPSLVSSLFFLFIYMCVGGILIEGDFTCENLYTLYGYLVLFIYFWLEC